jgi:endo-1,4-beta-D-glucanase Y
MAGVSEGQAYGMLFAAVFGDQATFDGIFKFWRAHPSKSNSSLMSWEIKPDGSMPDPYPALDGDLDATLALLMASRQWGGNYAAEASKQITAIKAVYLKVLNTLSGNNSTARGSDQMPQHFHAFAKMDASWNAIADRSYQMLQAIEGATTGLIPEWIANVTSPTVIAAGPTTGGTDAGQWNGAYDYNACRTPLRIGVDWLVNGDARAKAIVQKMAAFWATVASPQGLDGIEGRTLAGAVTGRGWHDPAFMAPVMIALMSDPARQALLDALWAYVVGMKPTGYYGDSLKLLSMIVVSGNWWAP